MKLARFDGKRLQKKHKKEEKNKDIVEVKKMKRAKLYIKRRGEDL